MRTRRYNPEVLNGPCSGSRPSTVHCDSCHSQRARHLTSRTRCTLRTVPNMAATHGADRRLTGSQFVDRPCSLQSVSLARGTRRCVVAACPHQQKLPYREMRMHSNRGNAPTGAESEWWDLCSFCACVSSCLESPLTLLLVPAVHFRKPPAAQSPNRNRCNSALRIRSQP